MKITYLKLENVAGLYVGSNRSVIEINLDKSKNKIVALSAENGKGKTTLLSSLHPFATISSIDDRSSISYILQNKDGYKEIHYQHNNDKYIIKHYFKHNKSGSHSIKSYFMKNGEELNDNGNVTSFNQLVEMHMGLTQEMMRLIRIGSNVNSFVSLTPARRKEYLGKLIEEIDLYLNIYKKLNEDSRVLKILIQTNTNNLYTYHIDDILIEEDKLKSLNKSIKVKEKEKEVLISKISKLDALIKDNDIDDLRNKEIDSMKKLKDMEVIEKEIIMYNLSDTGIDDLINKRNTISNKKIDIQSNINSYRINIDNNLANIDRLELLINKVSSNNDINSLLTTISDIKNYIQNVPSIIKTFIPRDVTSDEVIQLISKLNSFNQISRMIYTFGNKPINVYLKIRNEEKSIDKWIKKQVQKNVSSLNKNDIQFMFDKLFQSDDILSPNCIDEFKECPYYRFSELFMDIKSKYDNEVYDEEVLRYIQIISNNIDNILNEIDSLTSIDIPDKFKYILKEESLIEKLHKRQQFFDVYELQEYLSLLKNYEIYINNVNKLKEYEYQLSVYKQSGIDNQMSEIRLLKDNINDYNNNIKSLTSELASINSELELIDKQIVIVTKSSDNKKYKEMIISTLENTKKLLIPLENAHNERMELMYDLKQIKSDIDILRNNYQSLDLRIKEYRKLLSESKKLNTMKEELNIILESVGTKKGIPVLYMKKYLNKIQNLTNNLLSLIYGDTLKLAKFNINRESFEIPYIKNGKKVPDIKYASQSELAMCTMALSFALAINVAKHYNILLLDEVEAGLDEINRSGFIKMLYAQMNEIHSNQVFIISQNLSQMINVPMDVILLSERNVKNDLENIIFE